MNEIILRFVFVKNNKIIDAKLDKRISFRQNFKMLSKIINEFMVLDIEVYDPYKKLFLDLDMPIGNMNISDFRCFKLF